MVRGGSTVQSPWSSLAQYLDEALSRSNVCGAGATGMLQGDQIGTFPVTRSMIEPAALAKLIEAAYGLQEVSCRLIKAASRDVYHVESQQGPRVLIVYRHGRRTAAEIEAELDVL